MFSLVSSPHLGGIPVKSGSAPRSIQSASRCAEYPKSIFASGGGAALLSSVAACSLLILDRCLLRLRALEGGSLGRKTRRSTARRATATGSVALAPPKRTATYKFTCSSIGSVIEAQVIIPPPFLPTLAAQ